jgi:F420-dependent oxidoreductase-like protein
MEIAIMIEGQMGLTWTRWQSIALAVEELGFAGLYRSDHITNPEPPDSASLELWVSLTWLASHTKRIEFGPLVSPVSFRDPVTTARTAVAVDDLSGGRLRLGIGAGWQEREHANFGYDLLPPAQRFKRYREGVEVITRLIQSDTPVDYQGEYYRLRDALVLPRPRRAGGPPIVIGGNKGVLRLAARYADEWNVPFITPDDFGSLNRQLDSLLQERGRQSSDVRRSVMTGLVFGRNDGEVRAKIGTRDPSIDALWRRGLVVGTGNAVVEQVGQFAAAGVQCLMLQWLDLDDLDGLAALAQTLLPRG